MTHHTRQGGWQMRVRAVFFDLDGTLLRDDHVDGVVHDAARSLALTRPDVNAAALADAHAAAWWDHWSEAGEEWMLGRPPIDALPREVWRRSLLAVGVDDAVAVEEAYALHAARETGGHRLYPESLEVLAVLRERGIRLGLITNGPSDLQRSKLRTVGIEDAFDAVIVSGEVGAQKPQPEIFARALAAIGESAEASVHIGDNLVADIAGAAAAGLTAVWIDRGRSPAASPPVPAPHHTITDLRTLLTLLA